MSTRAGVQQPGLILSVLVDWLQLFPSAAAAKSLQSCLTLRPHGWQPTRLPHPCDSPGKNTGVVCHFPLQCMNVKNESQVIQSCPTPSDPTDCSLAGSSVHGSFQAGVLEWVASAFSLMFTTHLHLSTMYFTHFSP